MVEYLKSRLQKKETTREKAKASGNGVVGSGKLVLFVCCQPLIEIKGKERIEMN
jgi:hypothetical protein